MTLGLRSPFAWALVAVAVAATIALIISLQLGIFVLCFSIIAWWTWQQPQEAGFFLIVITPLLPLLKMTQTIGTATLVKDVILITLFVCLFLLPLVTKHLAYRRNVLVVPMVMLGGLVMWSMLRADSLALGVVRARDIILYMLAYTVALYLPRGRDWYGQLLRWFLASLLVVLVLGVHQWFFVPDSTVLRFDPARQIWIPRLSSTLVHPSVFGHYIILAASVLIALALVYRRRWAGVSALALAIPIFLTYSRAVWAAYAIALLVAVTAHFLARSAVLERLRRQWKRVGIVLIVSFISFVGLGMYTPVGTLLRSSFDPQYASNAERIQFAVRLIGSLENIEGIIGRGLGDTQTIREVELEGSAITSGAGQSVRDAKDATLVDNQYLKTFVEMGLLGILVYVWIYYLSLQMSWRLLKTSDALSRALGIAGISFIAAFIFQAAFIDVWDIFPTNMAFWFLTGLLSSQIRSS